MNLASLWSYNVYMIGCHELIFYQLTNYVIHVNPFLLNCLKSYYNNKGYKSIFISIKSRTLVNYSIKFDTLVNYNLIIQLNFTPLPGVRFNRSERSNPERASRIGPQKGSRVPSWQCAATHIFDDLEQIDGTWMGCFEASALYAPSDYHLFRALQNSLDGKKLADRDVAENHLAKFFDNKPQKFYNDGIMKLSEKWQKVIDNNSHYVELIRIVFQ